MTLMGFKDEPDFINEEGTKFWIDISTTQYAQRQDSHGTTLDMVAYLVETSGGYMTRILVDKEQNIIDDQQNLEQLAVKIDMLKASKRFDQTDKF